MNITVYLGARDPDNPALTFAARELGTWIGANSHQLIYGGSYCGLMGELAESTLLAGGRVTGVEQMLLLLFLVGQELLKRFLRSSPKYV